MRPRRFWTAFVAVLALASSATDALAQRTTGILQGRITDKLSGEPLEGLVLLRDFSHGRSFAIRARKNGRFYKRDLPPATYELTVQAEGYTSVKHRLRVAAGAEERLEFELLRTELAGADDFAEGVRAMKAGDVAGAIRAFEAAASAAPRRPEVHVNLGLAYLRVERNADAVAELQKAVELAPGEPRMLFRLGGAYVAMRDWDRAVEAFEAGFVEPPDLAGDELAREASVTLGAVYLAKGDSGRSIAVFEKILAAVPGSRVATLGLARAHLRRGDVDQALQLLTQVLTTAPGSAEAAQAEALLRQLERGKTGGG